MNNPREIMARIRRNRRQESPASHTAATIPAPAPMTPLSALTTVEPARSAPTPAAFVPPVSTTPAPTAFPAQPPATPSRTAVPVPSPTAEAPAVSGRAAPDGDRPRLVSRPVGGHALYSELMRSHDRMGTRHLASTPLSEPPRGEG